MNNRQLAGGKRSFPSEAAYYLLYADLGIFWAKRRVIQLSRSPCYIVCVDCPLFALPTTITGVNVCVDWPLFALPTSITGDYHPPETPIVYHRVRKCKFSKCQIAYYPNATATRRILLLFGDIEVNPSWGNGLKKFDPTHVPNNQRPVGSTPPVNSNIPVRISERRYSTH